MLRSNPATGIRLGAAAEHVSRIGRAVRLVWSSGPGWAVANGVLLFVQGMLPVASLYLFKSTIDTVSQGLVGDERNALASRVILLIGVAAALGLLAAVCRALASVVSETQAQLVTDHVLNIIHIQSIDVDLDYYENSDYYDKLHLAQREAPYRPARILASLVDITQGAIAAVAMAALLFTFHWSLPVILIAASTPGVVAKLTTAGQLYQWRRQRASTDRKAGYYDQLLTQSAYAKEIRLFDLGSLFRHRFRALRASLRRERLQIARRRVSIEVTTEATTTVAVYIIYGVVAVQTVSGALTLGSMVMFYQASQRFSTIVQSMLLGMASLYEDSLFLSALDDFVAVEKKVVEPILPEAVPRQIVTGIHFDRVTFRYAGDSRAALQNVSLRVRPGEVIALVGENGAGKTTLAKLLCRLYDPTEGVITLDGTDLRNLRSAEFRRVVGVMTQDFARYHLTARENIWFGNLDLPMSHERVATAAEQSGADRAISALTDGYETFLGKHFEDGAELSVGEWQKLALARVLFRDAQILILDEPTSALDARTEYELFGQFRQLAAGRAAVLISHRLSTVRMADHIYVLEKGSITEDGTHDELVQREGTYARLFGMQARAYR